MQVNARNIAFETLLKVNGEDAFLNLTLDAALSYAGDRLSPQDRALATELSYGVVRRQRLLDVTIGSMSSRPPEKLDPDVLVALRLGAYQLLFTRTRPHAAVNETVELVKSRPRSARAVGFVNALLRKIATLGHPVIPDTASPIAQMAIEYSFPTWLVDRWVKRFGMDEARELCRVQAVPPALDIRLDPRRITRDCFIRELEEQGVKCSALPHSTVGVSVSGCGNVSELPLFSQGAFQIQDEAAQLVGLLPDVKPGMRILDACAAPGGKTCHLAQRLEGKGEILATDLYDHRLERLEDEARRLKLSDVISTQARDVSLPLDVPAESFDLILADLPCTGLGTTNRHPEIRYRRSREDPARMAAVQAAILKNLARYVRKGGQLVYSVCSMEPEEGREQVAYIESLGFRLVPPSDQCGVDWDGVRDGESLAIATYPHRHGCDGFFGARFEKV